LYHGCVHESLARSTAARTSAHTGDAWFGLKNTNTVCPCTGALSGVRPCGRFTFAGEVACSGKWAHRLRPSKPRQNPSQSANQRPAQVAAVLAPASNGRGLSASPAIRLLACGQLPLDRIRPRRTETFPGPRGHRWATVGDGPGHSMNRRKGSAPGSFPRRDGQTPGAADGRFKREIAGRARPSLTTAARPWQAR